MALVLAEFLAVLLAVTCSFFGTLAVTNWLTAWFEKREKSGSVKIIAGSFLLSLACGAIVWRLLDNINPAMELGAGVTNLFGYLYTLNILYAVPCFVLVIVLTKLVLQRLGGDRRWIRNGAEGD